MKWFKHDTDMHADLKIHILIEKHGLEGYGIWNLCLEMVGQQGKKGRIDGQLRWRQLLLKVAGWSEQGKLDNILSTMAEVKLICPKSFKYGNLFIPKFMKRGDDYTMRKLRSEFGQATNNVHVDKKRTEEIRKEQIQRIVDEYIKLKDWDNSDKDMVSYIYKRSVKTAKNLALIAKERDIEALKWLAGLLNEKGLDWTLDTIVAWLPKFFKSKQTSQIQQKQGQEAQKKLKKMQEEAQERIPKKELDGLINQVLDK